MNVCEYENIRPFDVDGCLIVDWRTKDNLGLLVRTVKVFDAVKNKNIVVGVNESMVRLLEEEYHRGGFIIVWSRSGWEWAKNVVIALNLQDKVHEVKSKPIVYFDNEPIDNWLKDRVFIGPDVPYKR